MNKNYIIIFLLIFSFGCNKGKEDLTEQQKQKIIFNLRNANSHEDDQAYDAILKVIKYKLSEAVPEIEKYFNIQDNFAKEQFLDALNIFHSSNTTVYAHLFLDSLDLNKKSERRYIFGILSILFENGDISKYQLALDELDRNNPILRTPLLYALSYIAKNIHVAKDEAINGIKRIATESDDHYFRWYAFNELDAIMGAESVPFLLERIPFENNNSPSTAIYHLLGKHKSPLINSFIKEQVNLDYNKQVREALTFVLVNNYNTLDNFKFLTDLYSNFPNRYDSYIFRSHLYTSNFIRKPERYVTTLTILDTLTSYTNKSYGFGWLADKVYKNVLLTKLTNAKTKLSSGDSLGCKTEVATFHTSVNQVYQDSTGSYPKYVSDAGYKFMYHYAQFILDRLQ